MSRTRTPTPPPQAPEPPKSGGSGSPRTWLHDAIAHEEPTPGDKVRKTFRVVLRRSAAEALAARAIREEKNIGMLVAEILEGAMKRKA